MRNFLFVFKNDVRLIFRDKSLYIMFIIPIAMIIILRSGLPRLTEVFPVVSEYYKLILAALTSLAASTPAYLIGFLILDERDENLHTIQNVLPLPPHFILKCRIFLMVLLGFMFSVLILLFNGNVSVSLLQFVAFSILFSLVPPILTFTIVAFAKNKIEAATIYKGLNLILFLPVVAFFVESIWKYLFGIIPFFWTFLAVQKMDSQLDFWASFFISLIIHLIFIVFLYRIYKRKII